MEIVEDDDERPCLGERFEQAPDAPERLLDRPTAVVVAERRRDPFSHARGVLAERHEPGDLGDGVLGCLTFAEACSGLNDLGDRPERDPLAVGETPALENRRLVRDRPGELERET